MWKGKFILKGPTPECDMNSCWVCAGLCLCSSLPQWSPDTATALSSSVTYEKDGRMCFTQTETLRKVKVDCINNYTQTTGINRLSQTNLFMS